MAALYATRTDRAPIAGMERERVAWVEPRLVADVIHFGWTGERRLRFPVLRGLEAGEHKLDGRDGKAG